MKEGRYMKTMNKRNDDMRKGLTTRPKMTGIDMTPESYMLHNILKHNLLLMHAFVKLLIGSTLLLGFPGSISRLPNGSTLDPVEGED